MRDNKPPATMVRPCSSKQAPAYRNKPGDSRCESRTSRSSSFASRSSRARSAPYDRYTYTPSSIRDPKEKLSAWTTTSKHTTPVKRCYTVYDSHEDLLLDDLENYDGSLKSASTPDFHQDCKEGDLYAYGMVNPRRHSCCHRPLTVGGSARKESGGLTRPKTTAAIVKQIAEDGRRQSKPVNGSLPPLASRGTPGRDAPLGPLETGPHDGHWKLERRSLSESTDQKIISHLRRQLNRRLEKRMQELIATELSDHSDDEDADGKQAERRHLIAKGGVSALLDNYTEHGERKGASPPGRRQRKLEPLSKPDTTAQNGASNGRPIPAQPPILPSIGERQPSSMSTDSMGRPRLHKSVSLSEDEPEILNKAEFVKKPVERPKEQKQPDVPKVVETPAQAQSQPEPEVMKEKEKSISGDEVDQEILYLTREETDLDKENFSSVEVSPVPTPMVYRPETREAQRYSYDERVERILKGSMNVKVPADSKILRLYISSAFTDSMGERSRLIQKAYPELKEFCTSRGYELHIMDLHWGMADWVTDDHTGPEKAMQLLEKCTEGARTLSFVTFLSQRYGPSLLPTTIPADEFQLVLKEVEKEFEIQRKLTQQRMAALKEAQLAKQREQSGEEDDEGVELSDGEAKEEERVASVTKNDEKTVRFSLGELKTSSKQGDGSADSTLLSQWYKLDENTVPPVYKLQRISTHIKDILRNDPTVKKAAKHTWKGTADKMLDILQKQAKNVLTDPRDQQKYFQSAVDREIETGLLYADNPDDICLWYDRSITDISSHLGESKAKGYVDLRADVTEVEPERAEHLKKLRTKMTERLSKKNTRFYEVNWSSEGIDERVRAHDKYFEKVAVDFKTTMLQRLETLVKEDKKKYTWKIQLYEEVSRHVDFCHDRARQFHGRKELLNMIKRYIRSKYRHPLIVHGRSGCGKTSLMSKAAKDTYKWFKAKGKNSVTVVRMVGVTSASTNIRLLLKGICTQLCIVFGNDPEELPDDYKGIMNDFSYRISQATEEQPLIIFIDSLNQLSDDFDARRISWLPKDLPEHVHLIVSTLPDERYDSYNCLKSAFPKGQNFIEVPQMQEGDAVVLLDHWLKTANRGLTNEQFDTIVEAFKKCPLPLYLKISYEEALLWPSYMALDKVKLSDTIKKAVSVMFARLETTHGEPLVRRALGYLTAARNGVTQNEMEDLLSLDDAVMDDISHQIKPPFRRCPSISWFRLRLDLKDYIVERSADNCKPLQWFQSQFVEAAEERYLNQKDKAPSYHKALAEYFQGVWSTGKPVGSSESRTDRYVSPQPLYEEVEDSEGETIRVHNLRKLSELPYNLLKAVMFDEMKTQTLCNFEFLLAKLHSGSLRSILDDFQMALMVEPDDADLKLVAHTLHLSSNALKRDKFQLATQLVGRLQEIVSKDVPVSHADPRKFPFLQPLFRQAVKASVPSLIPSMACLTQPDGILFDLLSGHREPITAVANTSDGLRALTTSKDDTLKLWDLRQGKVTKTIRDVGAKCHMINTALNNSLVITSEASMIRIWSLRSGECVKVIDEYVDPASICLAKDGSILAAFYDGSLVLRTWALKPQIVKLTEVKLQQEDDDDAGLVALHKDRSIIAAQRGHGEKVLSAFRSASYAVVHSAKSGEHIFTLKSSDPGASVTAVAVSTEYFIMACRYQYMKHHEIFYLELFDVQNGSYIRKIRGCTVDDIKDLMVNQIGSHALCVCGSEQNNTSNIAVWNLETEDHKHLAFHATVSSMGACSDLRYFLTGSKTENALRVWNMSKSVNQSAAKVKTKEGIREIHIMKDHPKYVIAESFERGVIFVWNITRDRFTGQVVRKERGLIDKQDVILFRNERAIVLADRAISSVTEDNQQVFQTLFVYNLITKKYERKIKDCFIVPSPQHEFKVLSDDRLMGLSENRSHFMVWNMKNGHVAYRIRPNFRDLERKRLEWGISVKQEPEVKPQKPQRSTTAMMTPWERRSETESARKNRKQKEADEAKKRVEDFKKEKENAIEQYMLSGDEKIIVASFFAHHLCVFNVDTHEHLQTLEDENSMLYLYVAALTQTGSHLVLTNYDEEAKVSYVTLWDCQTGEIRKRLKNEKNVCAIAINDAADRVVFAKETTEMRIWDPTKSNSLRRVKGYKGLKFGVNSKIQLLNDGERAAVFAGDISMWDLDKGEMLSVFTPDMNIQCFDIALDGQLIVFGLRDIAKVVTLRMSKNHRKEIEFSGKDIFGEKEESSDDDSDEEDQGAQQEEEEEEEEE